MKRARIFEKDSVCGVVAARTAGDVLRQIRSALRYTNTIELRLDWLANAQEAARLLAQLKKNRILGRATFIATCRGRQAGGKFSGTVVEQLNLLRSAINAGCEWVDLEVETTAELPRFTLGLYTAHAKRILSHHDFHGTPDPRRLARLARKLGETCDGFGFDAVKIATECDSLADSLRVLALARHPQDHNVVAVPMGEVATPARVLAPRFGSALSYAPVEEATAPGQIPLGELHDLYRASAITRRTRVYGIIGNPIAHSLSPVLHNTAFRARKLDAVYLPFRVADLKDFLRAIEPLGICGFSITLPHKEKILRHLDDCDPLAAAIGAVNTVVVRGGGKLFGYNTDYVGVLRAIERRMPIAGSRVLILGAGGAARAVAFALAKGGAAISIYARRMERGRKLAREAGGDTMPRAALKREFFDAIVNATPVGMHPNTRQSPLNANELNCRIVFDTIYRPRRTKLLQLAAAKGIETILGVEMFLAQGIAQWEIWTGMRAPEALMRRAVLRKLEAEERKQKES
ncbi:MAG TPA: shikimate dehydrogenase [Candidatus Acidoferrales bacterium]|nr:shikimate dehydrogenase [Candidatus Acidoferrales bacterium]